MISLRYIDTALTADYMALVGRHQGTSVPVRSRSLGRKHALWHCNANFRCRLRQSRWANSRVTK